MLKRIYRKPCPCRGCELRNEECHEKGKCKSDYTYHEWKTDYDEFFALSNMPSPAKRRALRKARLKD